MKAYHSESGQSLIELIIIVPLFFIVLSGVNFYLNQKIKSFTVESAYQSLQLSDSNFNHEERQSAHWLSSEIETTQYNKTILSNSLNPSTHFSQSSDMSNGVFFDKKRVENKSISKCAKTPSFTLLQSPYGEFKFDICASEGGFEAAEYSFDGMTDNMKPIKTVKSGKSIYYPEERFSWENRSLIATSAIQKFMLTPEGIRFQKSYASLMPAAQSTFNKNCYMEPFEPSCIIPPLKTKWKRAAYDGANTQILECFAEMSVKCLELPTPITIAACVTKGTAQISLALKSGYPAAVCPLLNRITKTIYDEVLITSKILSTKTISETLIP